MEEEQFRRDTINYWISQGSSMADAVTSYDDIIAFLEGREGLPPAAPEEYEPEELEEESEYAAQLELLQEMPSEERKVYLIQQTVVSEQAWLDTLLQGWKEDRSFTLKEIREQRKRVQVWSRRLTQAQSEAKQMLSKSEQNATPSE